MTKEEFDKYLEDRYRDQVKWYGGKARHQQKRYRLFQWSVIVLSAVTPVLIAIDSDLTHWPAVVISALVAIGASVLKTFKYQENWINYRTTAETLKKEYPFYQARVGEYAVAEDPEGFFVERVEAVISRENTLWLTAQKLDRSKKSST